MTDETARAIDSTANVIIHGLYAGSWNEMITNANVEHLQAMARLWLMRDDLLRTLKGVRELGITSRYGVRLFELATQIETLEAEC